MSASNNLALAPGSTTDYLDKNYGFDTAYQYRRDYTTWAVVQDPTTFQYYLTSAGGYFYVPATFKKIILSENQAVDSRLDLRFSDVHYQDVNFKDGAYRGGLYVGNNSDGSKVGRSYLKFGVSSGDVLWPVGYLYAFKTRFARSGTISLKVRKTATTWEKQSLVWTNAPAPQAEGYPSTYVEWNSTTPVSEWNRFRVAKDIETATGNTLSLSLLSETESSAPWAYFARKEWGTVGELPGIHPPYLLYAIGGEGAGEYTDPDLSGGDGGDGGGGYGGPPDGGYGYGGPPGGGGGYGGPPGPGSYPGKSGTKPSAPKPTPPAKKVPPVKAPGKKAVP